MEGRGSTANASQTARCETLVEDSGGSLRRCMACVEGWLITEPAVSAKVLMERLATMIPNAYASKTQLRTLQRRVKAWRAERAKDLVLGRLRVRDASPAEV